MSIAMESLARRFAFVALFFVSVAANALNQESSPPRPPIMRSEVREILVPFVVMDGRGRHISELKASDFQVFEDGKPQRVVAFSVESTSVRAAVASNSTSAGVNPSPDDPRRTYLVIVDTLHSSFANFGRVREALGKFFEKEQATDSQYAVIALGREAKVVQDSTRDASAVLAAIRSDGFHRIIRDSEAANLAVAIDQFVALMRNYCALCECVSAGNHGELPGCSAAKSRVRSFIVSFTERTFVLNQQFLRQLADIVKTMANMPTSRTVLFISDGFNRISGRELYAVLMGYGPKDRTFQFGSRDTQPELDAVLKVATRSDVKFYTIDSRGVYTLAAVRGSGLDASSSSSTHTQMDSRASPNLAAGVPEAAISHSSSAARDSTDALALLANETGGQFFEGSNDLMKSMRQAVADGREYYVLRYVPENGAMDGKYRRILVTARDKKWRVNAKAGYWAAEE